MIEGKYKSIQGETIIELEDKKYHLVEAGHHHEGNKDHEGNCFEEFGHYRVFNSGMLEFTDEREIIEGKEVEADKDWATYQVGLIVDNYIIDEVDKLNIKDGNKAREEIEGCEEKIDFKFLKFVLGYRKNKRTAIVELLNNTNTRKLIFKSRRQLNKWYYEEFKEKMQI